MPIDNSLFSSALDTDPTKQDTLAQTSEAKAVLLSDITRQKRERMLAPVNAAIDAAMLRADAKITNNPAYQAPQIEQGLPERFVRGVGTGLQSIPAAVLGVGAIGAAAAETVLGPGDITTKLKNDAVGLYTDYQKHMSKDAQPEDSFTYSYEQAKQGNPGALLSWAAHGTGYVTSQLASILVGAGIIGKGVELVGKRAIIGATSSLIEKEAAQLATAAGVKTATEAMVKEATANITNRIAGKVGTGVVTTVLEGGEIGGDLAHQSVERGTPLTGAELGRGAVATAAASAVEYLEVDLLKKAYKGKLGGVSKTEGVAAIGGMAGKAVRGGVTAAKVAPAEFAQEGVQTGIEIWGKGDNPLDGTHNVELLDSAMLGTLSAGPAGLGASFHGSTKEKQAAQLKAAGKRIVEAEAQPGFVETVQAAVEAKNADKYLDPKSKDYNPVAGVKALKVLNQDETTPIADKHTHYNTAVTAYNKIREDQYAFLDRAADPKDPLTEKQAIVAVDYFERLKTKILPEIQAMGTTGTISPELKELLEQASDTETVNTTIAQILGSRSSVESLGNTIDADAIINNPAIGEETKSLVGQIKSLAESKKALTDHATNTGKIEKTTERVTENVFAGTDGQKGINDHIAAIQVATDSGNTALAQKELDGLAGFTQSKQIRATTFRNILNGTPTEEDTQNLAEYNKERLIKKQAPYSVGPAFKRTIEAMELEADALSKALVLGSTISKLTPSSTSKVAPDQAQEVPPTRDVAPAVSPAPTSTMSPTPFAREPVTPGVGDIITATEPVSNEEAPADEVTVPVTEANLSADDIKAIDWVNSLLADQQQSQNYILDNRFQRVIKLHKEKKITSTIKSVEFYGDRTHYGIPADKNVQSSKKIRFTNHSGGAIGSDTYWGEVGDKYGVKSNHYYAEKTPKGNIKITAEQLIEGIVKAKQAAKDLGKSWSGTPYVQGLLARNWQQVKNADAIFAVGKIDGKYADGGTGYAIAMAVREGKPIYIFDQERNSWFKREESSWKAISTPTLTPNFAGIGTRRINANGKKAIEAVYDQTFNKKASGASDASAPSEVVSSQVKNELTTLQQNITKEEVPSFQLFDNLSSEGKAAVKAAIHPLKPEHDLDTVAAMEAIDYYLATGKNLEAEIKKGVDYSDIQKQQAALDAWVIEINSKKDSLTPAEQREARSKFDRDTRDIIIAEGDLEYDMRETLLATVKSNQVQTKTETSKKEDQVKETKESLTKQSAKEKESIDAKTDTIDSTTSVAETSQIDTTDQGRTKTVEGEVQAGIVEGTVPANDQVALVTPRDETDTNKIRTTFQVEKNESYFHRVADFLKSLGNLITQEREAEADPDKITLLASMQEFIQEFTEAAKANFQYKKREDYHHEDPMQWLAAQGVLPDRVVTAVSATTYKWLATRAVETEMNDEDDARGILSLGSDAALLPVTLELVSDIGSSSTSLDQSIGKEILKVIGIKASDTTQAQEQERVEASLGLFALATMQKLGYLERINISSAAMGKLKTANKEYDLDFTMTQEEFRVDTSKAGKQETSAKFFKIIPSEKTQAIKQAYAQSKGTWDVLFTGEEDKAEYSWDFNEDTPAREELDGTKEKASKGRTEKKNKNVAQPIGLATQVMNIFESLDQETQEVILGVESTEGLHAAKVRGVKSTNAALKREHQQYLDWKHNAGKQPTGLKALFRIPAWFGGNTRMYQEGSINMLMNKSSHRYMFSYKDWEGSFDLSEETDPQDPETLSNRFIEAVGQSLKVEASKDQSYLQSTRDALGSPVIVEALAAIQKILERVPDLNTLDQDITAEIAATLDPTDMAAIAKGVKAGKLHMHTLLGLVEYQRFVNAQALYKEKGDKHKSFTYNIPMGMDGLANGVLIGYIQLTLTDMASSIKDTLEQRVRRLGILLSGGLSFTDEVGSGDHAATYDPYQAIGGIWGNELAAMEKGLADEIQKASDQSGKDAAIKKLKKIQAAKSLLGPLYNEDGLLAGITRKLAKDNSVPALYGAGEKALVLGLLSNAFIKKAVEERLQSYAASDSLLASQEFKDFRNSINTVAGSGNWGDRVIQADGSLNQEELLKLKLTPEMKKELRSYIETYHGAALKKAIDAIYGEGREAGKHLNQAIAIGVGYYNTAFQLLLDQHYKTSDVLTVGDLKAIHKKLRPLFPRVKTWHGDYIEVAELEHKKDYDKSNSTNIIQRYNDPQVSLLTSRAHEIGKLGNPGLSPVAIVTHMVDAAVAVEVLGNDFGAGVLNAHDNAMVGLHRIKEINGLMNGSFLKINSEFSIAEALQDSLKETEAAFAALGFEKGPELTAAIEKNFAELKLSVKVIGVSGKPITSTDPKDIVRENKKAVADVVAITNKNKALILGAVTQMNQYFVAGQGHKTGNKQQEKIGDIQVADIVSLAQTGVQTLAASNVGYTQYTKGVTDTWADVEKDILGSRLEPMSENPADYAIQKQIDSQNVVDTYDALKQDSTVIDTPEHDAHLKGILNTLVVNVMNPVQVFQTTMIDDETHGQFKPGENKLFIASQIASPNPVSGALANGIRMSTGEVYVHELVHAVTNAGLRANKYLERQVEVLYKIAEKSLDFRAFLNDPTIDVDDQANHYDVQAARERFDYVFRGKSVTKRAHVDPVTKMDHTEELSSHLDEFIALGLTNANFAKALGKVSLVKHKQKLMAKSSWAGIVGENLQATIINVFSKILEILHEKLDKGISANNVGAELQRLAKLLTKIDSKNKTRLYNLTQKGMQKYSKFASQANHVIKSAFKTMPVVKTLYHFKQGMKIAKESDTLLGQSIRNVEYRYKTLDQGLLKAIVTEMQGHTPRMDWIHRLLHRRKNFLDAAKTAEIANILTTANSLYHRKLTSAEKKTFLKAAMKPDLAYLLDHMSMNRIASLVNNKTAQQKEIDKIIDAIKADPALAPYAVYYQQSMNALGYHMVHGRFREGETTSLSTLPTSHLVNLTGHQGKLTKEQGDQADVLLNKLATLYALKYTPAQHLTILSGLIAEDSEGVARLLRLHNELKKDSLKYNFDGNTFQFIKGYTKEILNPRIDYKLGTLADEAEMKQLRYVRSEKPIERDLSDPTRHIDIYAYTADTGRVNDYLSQAASLTSNKPKGADTYRLAQQMDESTKAGANNQRLILLAKQKELDAMFFPHAKPLEPKGNPMVAQVDDAGKIIKYRYMMSETTKDDYLEKTNEFDVVMGAMAGQIIDKARTPVINEELIDGLKAMYDGEYNNNPEAYVEVSPYSADPKLREIYYMLPPAARKHIDKQWGSSRMFVAKDVLTIAFGYRKYSIVQAFAKTPAERHALEKVVVDIANLVFRSYGLKVANNVELVAMALTKLAKNNIVVKTLFVTLENFGSNIIHLKSRGVPMQQILTQGFEALQQGLKYQDDKQKLDQLVTKQKLMTDPNEIKRTELQIVRLKDAIARNPVTRFIEAGGLPSLVDDFETDVTQDNYPSKLEKLATSVTDKLPASLVNVGKVLFLTQDTGAYKIMNNAVKMTDFVARYVLYQHYMKKSTSKPGFNRRDQGAMDAAHSKNVMRVMEEFVNFDLPTHKTIEWLNTVGLVWFSKYALRIQKIIVKSVIDRPFDAAVAVLMASTLGFDQIGNSLLGVNRGLTSGFDNPVGMFVDTSPEIFTMTSMKALLNM